MESLRRVVVPLSGKQQMVINNSEILIIEFEFSDWLCFLDGKMFMRMFLFLFSALQMLLSFIFANNENNFKEYHKIKHNTY